MKHLFLDESGECSFSPKTIYTHFLITVVSIDPSKLKKMKKRLRKKIASFVRNGWNKTKEVKACELYKNRKFGPKAVSDVLALLAGMDSLEISYIVINKKKITNQSFRTAPYGTVYNYFTGILLSELIFKDGFHDIYLVFDKKNKETHKNKHFREYLETKIFGMALEKATNMNLQIEGLDSSTSYGLLAADFFSWAIFRRFEYRDDTFYSLLVDNLKRKREWYI